MIDEVIPRDSNMGKNRENTLEKHQRAKKPDREEVVISAYEAVTLNLRRVESTFKEYWIIEISVQAAAKILRRALRTRAPTVVTRQRADFSSIN